MVAQQISRPTQIYTEEKATHLIRVFFAVVSTMFLLAWQQLLLLDPLKRGKTEMELMDPSEIIATPFMIENVTAFATLPVVILMLFWLYKAPKTLSSNLLTLTKLTLVTYALFGLCGDNMVKNWKHSFLSAVYIGALATSTSSGNGSSNIMDELPFHDFSDLISVSRLYGMFLFMILFQVLSVLDRGIQIQRWPLPILLGGTYGYVGGTLMALFVGQLANPKKNQE